MSFKRNIVKNSVNLCIKLKDSRIIQAVLGAFVKRHTCAIAGGLINLVSLITEAVGGLRAVLGASSEGGVTGNEGAITGIGS